MSLRYGEMFVFRPRINVFVSNVLLRHISAANESGSYVPHGYYTPRGRYDEIQDMYHPTAWNVDIGEGMNFTLWPIWIFLSMLINITSMSRFLPTI